MKLQQWKDKEGLTNQQIADLVGVSQGSISRYINHVVRPEWPNIQKIITATNGEVTANDFLPDPPDEQGRAA